MTDITHASNSPSKQELESKVFSKKFYLRMFGLLVVFLVINICVYKAELPSPYNILLYLTVASIQTGIVTLFFMELIHEDKFYTFVFGSCILFIILFMFVSLAEITGRNFFHPDEGAHILRGFDKEGVYAPAFPKKGIK